MRHNSDSSEGRQGAGTDTAELRDALAAVAEAIDVPRPARMTAEQELAWYQECRDRAIIAAGSIGWMLKPGAHVADHVRCMQDQIAALVTS
jgi:hypothetical protein